MALIVKNTVNNSVKFDNTDVTIDNVYVRLRYFANDNGTSVQVELLPYENEQSYVDNKVIKNISLPKTVSGDVLIQNLDNVHVLVKDKLVDLGFDVTITNLI